MLGLFFLCMFGVAPFAKAQGQSLLYLTNGDSSSLQAIDTTTGNLVFSATSSSGGYAVAVRNTIWINNISNNGAAEYNPLTGAATGNTSPGSGTSNGELLDGAASATANFTLGWTGGGVVNVYSGGANWSNLSLLFTTPSSTPGSTPTDVMGITFDTVTNTLWLSDPNEIYQYSLGGTLLSQFPHVSERGSLAYQPSTNTFWYVPNSASQPLLQYSPTGTLLRTLTTPLRSGNIWGAEFSTVPEPSTVALLGFGVVLVSMFTRKKRLR